MLDRSSGRVGTAVGPGRRTGPRRDGTTHPGREVRYGVLGTVMLPSTIFALSSSSCSAMSSIAPPEVA